MIVFLEVTRRPQLLGGISLRDLFIIKGVVEQEQSTLAVQDTTVHFLDFRFVVRNLFIGMISMDDRAHCFQRRERIITCAPHVYHDLAIRIAIFERLAQLQSERRLANAPIAPQAYDVSAAGKLRLHLF